MAGHLRQARPIKGHCSSWPVSNGHAAPEPCLSHSGSHSKHLQQRPPSHSSLRRWRCLTRQATSSSPRCQDSSQSCLLKLYVPHDIWLSRCLSHCPHHAQ